MIKTLGLGAYAVSSTAAPLPEGFADALAAIIFPEELSTFPPEIAADEPLLTWFLRLPVLAVTVSLAIDPKKNPPAVQL
jgi:hypothetical protein